jgi:hypothetical protein
VKHALRARPMWLLPGSSASPACRRRWPPSSGQQRRAGQQGEHGLRGPLLRAGGDRAGAKFLPIDSEHNAIFQVLDRPERVEKLILTASGGPFRLRRMRMAAATPEQACAHPNWDMGAKISVDCATMMNKGLELIEAAYLFDVPEERIDVLVHPQSIIHSLVSYDDGSVLAQLGMPDMRTPISYALSWPDRMPLPGMERLDLAKIGRLDFMVLPTCSAFRRWGREGGGFRRGRRANCAERSERGRGGGLFAAPDRILDDSSGGRRSARRLP